MNLGNKILTLRKQKGLSQEALGDKINVTRQTISNWELGITSPNPEQLKLISKELNISIDTLLDNDTSNPNIKNISNTEKLAGLILKIIKIFLIITAIVVVLTILFIFLFRYNRNPRTTKIINESIYCHIYGEEHRYSISYDEHTGRTHEERGDTYFYDILDLDKYNNAQQIFNIINDYVKKNGGTCEIISDNEINNIVNISIKEGTLTKTSATILITENIDYNISYGEPFWIEKYNYQTNTYEILENIPGNNCGFNLPAYGVTPDNPLELYQDWSCMYGELPKGIYRLVKDAFFESDTPISEEDKFYIWVEFEIA